MKAKELLVLKEELFKKLNLHSRTGQMGGRELNEDRPRLIEVAFPLKQASLDSVHEKNVRHGNAGSRRLLVRARGGVVVGIVEVFEAEEV